MSKQPPQPKSNPSTPDLADTVLKRIESECIEPTPRWKFLCSEYLMWCLWLLSVVVGAAAVAVIIYVSLHAGYSFYEATHGTFWAYAVEAAPVLWLTVFALMAGLAYLNFRHTKCGYRYPVWQIFLSSVLASVVAGFVLHLWGAGHVVESMVDRTMPVYPTFEEQEREWWQQPEYGMLVGLRSTQVLPEQSMAEFADVSQTRWRLNMTELSAAERELLTSGQLVRVIGIRATTSDDLFYGCGVFPWTHGNGAKLAQMREEREAFLEKMSTLKKELARLRKTAGAGRAATGTSASSSPPVGKCPNMPLVKEMP